MQNKLKLLITGLFLPVLVASAQMNTGSPYSRFGFGELRHPGFASNLALGGAGIALRIPDQINYINPASYTSLDTLSFLFDFGVNGSYTLYETDLFQSELFNYNLDHIAISFPVTKWWKSGIGVTPFSSVGYNIKEEILLPVIGLTDYYFSGVGGLSKFFLGNAITPFKGLSLGFNFSYLFGYQNYIHTIDFPNNSYAASTQSHNRLNIKGVVYNFGVQYNKIFSEKYFITLGAIYDNEARLKEINHITNINLFPGSQYVTPDTTVIDPNYLLSADTFNNKITYPPNRGIGLSIGIKDKLILTGEYSTQEWSKLKIPGKNDSLVNSNSMNFGIEFTPGNKGSIKKYLNSVHYRLGGYYSNSYLRLQENQIRDYGITFGVGLPFRNTKTTFNLAFVFGQRGTLKNNLIKENYGIVNLSMTFHDIWFLKSVID